jgi:hypothetical protein
MCFELFNRACATRIFLTLRLLTVATLFATAGFAANAAIPHSDETTPAEPTPLSINKSSKAAADNFRGNGWWWGGPSLSGTGFFMEAQGDVAFVTFFMYDDAGKAIWYTASGSLTPLTGGSYAFSGDLSSFRGGQAAGSNTPSTPVSQAAGRLSITFSSATTATVQLPARSFAAQRLDFAGLNVSATGNQPELGWYWNAAQSGRGYAIEVQNGTMFLAMFHYNPDGSPTWNLFSGPAAASGTFGGDFLAITGGQSISSAYRAPNPAIATPGFNGVFTGPCQGRLTFPGNPVPTSVTRLAYGVTDAAVCRSTSSGAYKAVGAPVDAIGRPISADASILSWNQQGANGFAFVSGLSYITNIGTGQPPNYEFYDLFAKGQGNATYSYKAVTQAADAAGLASQLNAEGAAGFLYKLSFKFDRSNPPAVDPTYLMLVKSSVRNTTYSYRVIPVAEPGELKPRDLDAEGSAGYSYRGNYAIGGSYYRIHVKDNSSSATYNYLTTPAIDTHDALLNEMNAQGAQKYMYKGGFFTGASTVSLYEKVSTTTAPIVFVKTASSPNVSPTDLFAKAEPLAQQGYLIWGNLFLAAQYASYFYKGPPSSHPLYGPVFP